MWKSVLPVDLSFMVHLFWSWWPKAWVSYYNRANRMLRFVVQLPRNIKIWMSYFFKGHWTILFGWFPCLSNFLQHILYLCWELKLTYTPLTCKCFWIELFMMNLQFLYFNFLSFLFFFIKGLFQSHFRKCSTQLKEKYCKCWQKTWILKVSDTVKPSSSGHPRGTGKWLLNRGLSLILA